jgi:hypothetical protein
MLLREAWLVHTLVYSWNAIAQQIVSLLVGDKLLIKIKQLQNEVKSCGEIQVEAKLFEDGEFCMLNHLNLVLNLKFLLTKTNALLEIQDAIFLHFDSQLQTGNRNQRHHFTWYTFV